MNGSTPLFHDILRRVGTLARRCRPDMSRHAPGATPSSSFRGDGGSVLPIIAISSLALIGAIGCAVDGARMALMQSTLQSAIDAAGLSAAAKLNTTDFTTEARKFTEANFVRGYVGAEIVSFVPTKSANGDVMTLTAQVEAPTVFMSLFGYDKITATAQTEITKATTGMELALVLDVTGSMDSNGKLSGLKTAANDLMNILFGSNTSVDNLFVGIVPFSQTVNVGTSHTDWLASSGGSWSGCVDARYDHLSITDDPPSEAPFTKYSGSNCPNAITPLTSTKSTLTTAINNLDAAGYTHINLGAAWGWRLLSPRWRGEWGGSMDTDALPLDYGTDNMVKAAIIMTDGDNTMPSSRTAFGETDKSNEDDWTCTEYTTRTKSNGQTETRCSQYENRRLEITVASSASASSAMVKAFDADLSSICTAMKNAGIIVYTVAFGDPDNTTKGLLQGCATQPSYFFDSPTSADLAEDFEAIADSLSNLRVSR
ncbi:pilus assembly protein TadG-related protein [Consotaella aegiceratis]|uniref:pilus assembly protein TadG-related protein n=1 Tax=Consotaella aegiceratis TaxID=3097961 RepID=UPI002F40F8C3